MIFCLTKSPFSKILNLHIHQKMQILSIFLNPSSLFPSKILVLYRYQKNFFIKYSPPPLGNLILDFFFIIFYSTPHIFKILIVKNNLKNFVNYFWPPPPSSFSTKIFVKQKIQLARPNYKTIYSLSGNWIVINQWFISEMKCYLITKL